MPANPYEKYRENNVYTASREELTLMLYEGALKFCNQAIAAATEKNVKEAHRLILRVEDIIREFQITLDRQYEISQQFDMMYTYIYDRLVEANIRKDVEILKEVRDLLRQFRDTWKEAMVIAKREAAQPRPKGGIQI